MLGSIVVEARSASPHHRVDLELASDRWLLGSAKELLSAFSNLVFNAVHHTPEDARIQVRWDSNGDGGRVTVSDTGPGISAEHVPRLTERFYRVDKGRSRRMGGSGLGLAIVKHALARHGAELQIVSEIGKGSCFVCVFPADAVIDPPEQDREQSGVDWNEIGAKRS